MNELKTIVPLAEMVFVSEIVEQLKIADKSARQLSVSTDSIETWSCIQSVLIAIANISKILWPGNEKYGHRGEALRKVLEVKEDNLVSDRKFRNHFEHYDERIDEWFKESRSAVYIDRKVDIHNQSPFGIQTFSHRGYDPIAKVVYFRNEPLDLTKVFYALTEIREGCKKYGFEF